MLWSIGLIWRAKYSFGFKIIGQNRAVKLPSCQQIVTGIAFDK